MLAGWGGGGGDLTDILSRVRVLQPLGLSEPACLTSPVRSDLLTPGDFSRWPCFLPLPRHGSKINLGAQAYWINLFIYRHLTMLCSGCGPHLQFGQLTVLQQKYPDVYALKRVHGDVEKQMCCQCCPGGGVACEGSEGDWVAGAALPRAFTALPTNVADVLSVFPTTAPWGNKDDFFPLHLSTLCTINLNQ